MDLDTTVLCISGGFLLFAIIVGLIGMRMSNDQQ